MPALRMNGARVGRAGHIKSRTGCLTCRVRKVKCDESKPFCRKCTDTGRRCEGPLQSQYQFIYNSQTVLANQPPQIIGPPLSLFQHDEMETRAFQYFIQRAAPVLAGALDSTFWTRLIPQLCQIDAVVWDTVISISQFLEYEQQRQNLSLESASSNETVDPRHIQALRWYNRAMMQERRRLEQGSFDQASALLSCVLFVTIEFQQGNINNALSLLGRGVKLLSHSIRQSTMQDSTGAGHEIDEVLTPFFSGHAILIATFGHPLPVDSLEPSECGKHISTDLPANLSINRLRTELHKIVYKGHELVRITVFVANKGDEVLKLRPRQQEVLNLLEEWYGRLSKLLQRQHPQYETDPRIRWAAANLLMYYGVTWIWVSTCLRHFQTSLDKFETMFTEIIEHARVSLAHSWDKMSTTIATTTPRPDFTFDYDVIPPLFFVATKCRNPRIRREALELIRQSPGAQDDDSLWAVIPTAKIVECIISAEEGSCSSSSGLDFDDNNLTCISAPPEERRIHYVQVVKIHVPGSRRKQTLAVQMLSYEQDGTGRRCMKERLVSLEDPAEIEADLETVVCLE